MRRHYIAMMVIDILIDSLVTEAEIKCGAANSCLRFASANAPVCTDLHSGYEKMKKKINRGALPPDPRGGEVEGKEVGQGKGNE
jgi:hypothetical protein